MFQTCNTNHFVWHEIENFLPKESGLSTLPFRALKLHKYNVLLEHRKHCEIHESVPECLCECVCVERCCCGRKHSRICIAKFRSQSGVGWAPPHIHVENSRTRIRVECTQISYTHTRTDRCECAPVCDTTLDRYPGTLLQPAERYFSGHVPGNLRSSCKVIRFFFEIWR